MPSGRIFILFRQYAPRLLGALLYLGVCTGFSSCKRSQTPDWTSGIERQSEVPGQSETSTPQAQPWSSIASANTEPESNSTEAATGFRFVNYNVRNWLMMERRLKGKVVSASPKPESEKSAVVGILARYSPDIIGICEVGTVKDLTEIQNRLKINGINLPYFHYTGGTDEIRNLGLLSRYPIVASAKPAETEFQLNGQTLGINRGILDAMVNVRGKSYRFLGVHLKSKRESEYGDQESIRLNEARLLRRHVDSIFSRDPRARLVVYGDFNDTRSTPTLKTITGRYNSPSYLTAVPVKDSKETAWTHHWAMTDIYSRIDFVTISASLKREVDFKNSKILDDPDWAAASDHRPILTIFK